MHITFFKQKVENIRTHLFTPAVLPAQAVDKLSEAVQPLCSFSAVTQEEVEDIRKMKPSTCALVPFPSALLKANISAVSPVITKILNHSLQAGLIPSPLKTAVIRPLLKKPTLDPEVLSSTIGPFQIFHSFQRLWKKQLQQNSIITSITTTCLKNFSLVSALAIALKQPWSGSPTTS